MNDSIYRVCLDIHTIASQLMLDIKENDFGRKIIFTLTEAGKPYELTSDCSAVFRAKKPDGTVLYNGCVMRGNIIEYTLTAQTSAAVGILECELTIYGANNKQITSPKFEMRVDGNVATDSEIESQDEFTALNEAINAVDALDLDVTKDGHTTTLLLTKKDGTIEEVEVLDGEKGDKGDKGDTGEVSEEELQEALGVKVQIKDIDDAIPVMDDNYYVYGIDDNGEEVLFDGGTIVPPQTYYFKTVVIKKTGANNHELSFNYISQTMNAIENITDLRNDMNQFHGRISGNGHLGNRPIFDIEMKTTNELAATAREGWTSDTTFYTWKDSDFIDGGGSTIDVYTQQF